MLTNAKDLKTGMIFQTEETGDQKYVHIVGLHHVSQVSVWVAALTLEDYESGNLSQDTCFQISITRQVDVIGTKVRKHVGCIQVAPKVSSHHAFL